jgi:hypothetical protein
MNDTPIYTPPVPQAAVSTPSTPSRSSMMKTKRSLGIVVGLAAFAILAGGAVFASLAQYFGTGLFAPTAPTQSSADVGASCTKTLVLGGGR